MLRTRGRPSSRPAAPLAALALLASGLAGCRSTVRADPEEWTVERACEVIARVENQQVACARMGWVLLDAHGIPLFGGGPPQDTSDPGVLTCDSWGFDDYHVTRVVREVTGPSASEEFFATVVNDTLLHDSPVKLDPGERTEIVTGEYGVRRISFTEIERVVIARRAYPLYALLVVIGPWFHDVELEMKDGTIVEPYSLGPAWQNILPFWLYPVQWLHTVESEEYAEAIDFLRAKAEGAEW